MRLIVCAFAIAATACFPHNARHRRIAKISEGGALAAGIALQFVANANACMDRYGGGTVQRCDDGEPYGTVGLLMIFAGLVGFAATTMSGMQDAPRIEVDTPAEDTVTMPQAFCASLYAGDHLQAASALTTYVRSMGVTTRGDALDALHAFLSRQPCVVVAEDEFAPGVRFMIDVPERAQKFAVDATSAPFVMLLPR